MSEEIIDSLLERAEEMLKGNNSREIGTEEIITILKEYKKLQKENKKLKEDNYNLDRENQLKFDKIIKENAELKEENAKLRNTNEILYETGKQNAIQELLNENWVSKNKIRAKIKELESKKEQYTEQPLIYHILRSQLKELLGDDE